jgi:hypothetical protein
VDISAWIEACTRTVGRPHGSPEIVRDPDARDKASAIASAACAHLIHAVNRRSLIVMLIGVISAVVGGFVATFVEQRRCLDAGGTWLAAARQCQSAVGATSGLTLTSIGAGVLAGVFVAVFLYRGILFFARRGIPRVR